MDKLEFRIRIKWQMSMLLLVLTMSFLNAQNTGVYKKLYYNIYLSNSGSTSFLEDKSVHKTSLKSLKNFYDDKSARSRARAYAMARSIYDFTEEKEIKQKVVEDHLEGCIHDRSPSLRGQLATHLLQFDKKDYSEKSIELIKELISNDPNKKQYIVIAGYKEINEVLPDISNFTLDEVVASFDVIQGLARVGKTEAIELCRKVIEEHPMNMRFFNDLLPGLVFTNDKIILDAIISEILDDNDELIGARMKDYQRYYMMKHLIPLIYEYPYSFVDESQLTEDEFYQQLNFGLDWLNKHKKDYTLVNYEKPMESKSNPFVSKDLLLLSF